jgi:hypothetical protein
METINQIIESTQEIKRSRSPHKQITDSDRMPARLRQLAGLMAGANREGTAKLFTPTQLYESALSYFKHVTNNPIQSPQIITGGQKAGTVVSIDKPRMPSIKALCLFMGVNSLYIDQLEASIKDKTDDLSNQYSIILTCIRDTIHVNRIENAAVREYDAAFIAKLEGIKDQVEHSGEIKQTYTSIVFQTRNVEDIQAQDVTNDARSALETL